MSQPRISNRFAFTLAQTTLAGAIALPLMAAAIWLFWDHLAPLAAGDLQRAYDLANLGAGAKLSGFILSLTGALIQSYGLLALRRTFLEAAEGRPLSAGSVKGFRVFAWVALAMVFVGIIQYAGLSIILSFNDQIPGGSLSLQFGTREISAFFMAMLLVFVAHVFAEGKKAKDENESFL